MSGRYDEIGVRADDSWEPSPASRNMINVIKHCWAAMSWNYAEMRRVDQHSIKYASTRDMSTVLVAVLPSAVEFAAAARPEWATDTSPLAEVAGKYALCLASRGAALDVLADGFAPLLESPEEAEAFVLLSSAISLTLMLYMLVVPHMVDSIGEVQPELVSKALAGLAKGASWDMDGSPLTNWLARGRRRHDLEKLMAAGTLPGDPWITRFIQREAAGTIWDVLGDLVSRGSVTRHEIEGDAQDVETT